MFAVYEEQLVERLRNATSTCGRRGIDVAICLVESTRVMNRLLLAMPEDHGVLIVNSLNGAYKRCDSLPTETKAVRVEEVQMGSLCDLHKLVKMLEAGDVSKLIRTICQRVSLRIQKEKEKRLYVCY